MGHLERGCGEDPSVPKRVAWDGCVRVGIGGESRVLMGVLWGCVWVEMWVFACIGVGAWGSAVLAVM